MNFELFFTEKVPAALGRLNDETPAKWGEMSAAEMLDHLRKGVELSLGAVEAKQSSKEEHLPKLRSYLMGPKPFPPGSPAPVEFEEMASRHHERSLEELKLDLMKALIDMLAYLEKHPDHQAVHPVFGKLNVEEWQQLHYKHFRHHLSQFGLMENAL